MRTITNYDVELPKFYFVNKKDEITLKTFFHKNLAMCDING